VTQDAPPLDALPPDDDGPEQRSILLLWGMMGSGKSTIGRVVAERTGARFVDLDQLVEEQSGQSIKRIFEQRGEAHFRSLEQRALIELLNTGAPMVVALGGGTLVHDATRARALSDAFVVCLHADIEALLERTHGSHRPLLADGARAAMADLLKQRDNVYDQAHLGVNADCHDVDAIAEHVVRQWIGARVGTS
jgi:shikimate kinase